MQWLNVQEKEEARHDEEIGTLTERHQLELHELENEQAQKLLGV